MWAKANGSVGGCAVNVPHDVACIEENGLNRLNPAHMKFHNRMGIRVMMHLTTNL
jgi:hypothetical protein